MLNDPCGDIIPTTRSLDERITDCYLDLNGLSHLYYRSQRPLSDLTPEQVGFLTQLSESDHWSYQAYTLRNCTASAFEVMMRLVDMLVTINAQATANGHPAPIGDTHFTLIRNLLQYEATAVERIALLAREREDLMAWANNAAETATRYTEQNSGCSEGKRQFLTDMQIRPLSTDYYVTVYAQQTIRVTASNEDEAMDEARVNAYNYVDRSSWEINYDMTDGGDVSECD